jgi:Phosphoesterase family
VQGSPRRTSLVIAGTLLLASAACTVADPVSSPAPGPATSTSTVVPTAPRQTNAPLRSTPDRALRAPKKLRATPKEAQPTPKKVRPAPEKVRSAPKKPKAIAQRPDHIVVVIFENKHRSSVMGSAQAPYLNKLAARGASMTRSYGVTHPSQPNYLALFSGSTQGMRSNACPQHFRKADNLGHQLRKSGLSFVGYAESLPKTGFRGCGSGRYLRKHNPWVNFATLPPSSNRPFRAFPRDYRKLPTVAFVSPNMCHDMHDCSIRTGDRWMKKHFDRYARWAQRHNSLLVVTFDENAGGTAHSIPTIFVGANVRPGVYTERLNHYAMLRTIEDVYGLPRLGRAASASPVTTIWKKSPVPRKGRHGR